MKADQSWFCFYFLLYLFCVFDPRYFRDFEERT